MSYSEVINESVIEAVDSLNPYMHYKGVSYMVDNCSTTARLGAREVGPRFDWMLYQSAFPAYDSGATIDTTPIERFRKHPAHEAMKVLSRYRPSVDIALQG